MYGAYCVCDGYTRLYIVERQNHTAHDYTDSRSRRVRSEGRRKKKGKAKEGETKKKRSITTATRSVPDGERIGLKMQCPLSLSFVRSLAGWLSWRNVGKKAMGGTGMLGRSRELLHRRIEGYGGHRKILSLRSSRPSE